jgi:hypothetical protein
MTSRGQNDAFREAGQRAARSTAAGRKKLFTSIDREKRPSRDARSEGV